LLEKESNVRFDALIPDLTNPTRIHRPRAGA
jgi:hypothetical protein